jgi:WD40 repeat protein
MGCLDSSIAHAQGDRRSRKDPDIFLNTGGRTGTLDALMFTADGQYLIAAGEDKVARVWRVTEVGLEREAQVLRWSTWREQLGSIFALALSPDEHQRRIAIAGNGLRVGTVAIVDRVTGEVESSLSDLHDSRSSEKRENGDTIFALAFAPSGKRVAYGTWTGTIWLWNHAEKTKLDHWFVGASKKNAQKNVVRFIRFEDEDTLITTAADGRVLRWDVSKTNPQPDELFRFGEGSATDLYRVVLSPDNKWLAAAHSQGLVELRSFPDGKTVKRIRLGEREFARSLAFDATGPRLAVGINWGSGKGFFNQPGGLVRIYEFGKARPEALAAEFPNAYQVEGLAYTPDGKYLAVGGGDNHEVTLWDLKTKAQKSQIRGAGSCLWGVTLSDDGRFLGFCEEREPEPDSANHRARLPMKDHWRAFDLDLREFVPIGAVKNPFKTLESNGGWSVEPSQQNKYVLNVKGPDGKSFALPTDPDQDGVPLCWTFLRAEKDRPVRVLVGHLWGVSLFEIPRGGEPRRKRLYTGHQGEVTSLAVSQDQKWFVSCSRDQTISAWSLENWPNHPDLGASFARDADRIVVSGLQVGSPAWEAGLDVGDEVVVFKFNVSDFVYDAARKNERNIRDCLAQLEKPAAGREFYFQVRRKGQEALLPIKTLVKQRPLWRFFPSRNEWVLWMWKGNYYDTSTHGDSLIGWQLNNRKSPADGTPAFYKAEQFRELLHRSDVIDELLQSRDVAKALRTARGDNPQALDYGKIEPPPVRITVLSPKTGADERFWKVEDEDVTVQLIADPRDDDPDYQPQIVNLWINDYLFLEIDAGGRSFDKKVQIPNKLLRSAENASDDNELTLQVYNKMKLGTAKVLVGRAETTVHVHCARKARSPRLIGLAVGINDYSKARGPDGAIPNLKSAVADAREISATWSKQKHLYSEASLAPKLHDGTTAVTRAELLQALEDLAATVGPDDQVVLFLSGHGFFTPAGNEAGSLDYWVFCCPEFNSKKPTETGLTSPQLYRALAKIQARKLVILDSCHSGLTSGNPIRGLTPNGKGPTIFAACGGSRNAYAFEHPNYGHGVFTEAILEALDSRFAEADTNKDGKLDAAELFAYVKGRTAVLLKEVDENAHQVPEVFPPEDELDHHPLAQRKK